MRSIADFARLLRRLAAQVERLAEFRREPKALKPIEPTLISREPAFDVMISTTWRKSARRPLLSVSVAWSITCRRMLKMSGCAFSISSSRTTLYGCVRTASTSRPPCSKPTYPGGAPIRRDTACFSMNSLMS